MSPSPGGRLVLLLFIVENIVAQEILQAPESIVVFLDQSAVFTCETVGGALSWVVNGTQRELIDPEMRRDLMISEETVNDGGRTEQSLTIPARAEYNGTRVQCLVFSLSGSDQSENATMIIQGPPSAVADLKATRNETSITISWEAPWSLDVTGVDHDIWYSVLIQNVTDENNPTPISCIDCTNITETVYTFTPDHLTPCHVYNFSVTPFNGAGQGESSHNETSCTEGGSLSTLTVPGNPVKTPTRAPVLPENDGEPSMNVAMIAGIISGLVVISVVAVTILLLFALILVVRKKRKQRRLNLQTPDGPPMAVLNTHPGPDIPPTSLPSKPRSVPRYRNESIRPLLGSSVSSISVDSDVPPDLEPVAKSAVPLHSTLPQTHGSGVTSHSAPSDGSDVDHPLGAVEEEPDQENAEAAASQVQSVSQVGDDVTAVMLLLGGIVGRWKMIASGLGFDEDLIDTNNGTDEACLQDCVEKWASKLEPSWEKLSCVLRDLGEDSLAQQALERGSMCTAKESNPESTGEVVTHHSTPPVDSPEDETRGSKFMMLSDKEDSRVHEVMHFVAESDVYECYSDDGTTEDVEASHTVELSYSVKCRDSQNDDAATFLLGGSSRDVSVLTKTFPTPIFEDPPLAESTSITTQVGEPDKTVELSKARTTGVTKGAPKPQTPQLPVTKLKPPRLSRSGRRNRKKRKKHSSFLAKRKSGHTHHERIKAKKSSGNLPID